MIKKTQRLVMKTWKNIKYRGMPIDRWTWNFHFIKHMPLRKEYIRKMLAQHCRHSKATQLKLDLFFVCFLFYTLLLIYFYFYIFSFHVSTTSYRRLFICKTNARTKRVCKANVEKQINWYTVGSVKIFSGQAPNICFGVLWEKSHGIWIYIRIRRNRIRYISSSARFARDRKHPKQTRNSDKIRKKKSEKKNWELKARANEANSHYFKSWEEPKDVSFKVRMCKLGCHIPILTSLSFQFCLYLHYCHSFRCTLPHITFAKKSTDSC